MHNHTLKTLRESLADDTALVTPRRRLIRTKDGVTTYDQATIDSTGAFLIGELERFDPTLHEPLVQYTWSRDIDLRNDVSIADEQSSFSNSTVAATGGTSPNGKAWVGKDANAIASIALDIGKTVNPLMLWAMEVGYTLPELASAQQAGRPVDQQKLSGLRLKHQMDIDEMVYLGDSELGYKGLVNNDAKVTPTNVATVSGATTWAQKIALGTDVGPEAILADVNALLNAVWASSGYKFVPTSSEAAS